MAVSKRRLLDQIELNDHEKKNLQILDTIRKKGPIARAEISRLIGLNIVTVTSYVDQYIKKGVIREVGIDVSSGGRKPTLVDLNPAAIFLIGVGVNASTVVAILCNLKGEIVLSIKKERPAPAPEVLVHALVSLVRELMESSQVDISKVHGIGIGVPGIFNWDLGSARLSGSELQGRTPLSIHGVFEREFGLPTFVDNDSNATVFGEEWYGKGLGVQHAIYLYSANRCGFMINGQIYRGANGCAGEWLFEEESDTASPKWGTLDLGIALRACSSQKEQASSKIYHLVQNEAKKISLATVAKAAEMGDEFAIMILKEAGAQLGKKTAFLVNLFNPEVVVVGGGIENAGTHFFDSLRDTVKQHSMREATEKLRILPSLLGENGVPLGAAALVAQNYFISA